MNVLSQESLLKIESGHFYHCTGFTYDQLISLCVFLDASITKPPGNVALDSSTISWCNQILLTLMKLRLNVDNERFVSVFQIDLPTVKEVLTPCLDYMYDQLS